MDISFFKKKKTPHFGKEKENIVVLVGRHWTILLSVFFILMAGLLAFNIYLLYHINREEIFTGSGGASRLPKINQKRLGSVLDYFDARAEKSEAALFAKPVVTDPSL